LTGGFSDVVSVGVFDGSVELLSKMEVSLASCGKSKNNYKNCYKSLQEVGVLSWSFSLNIFSSLFSVSNKCEVNLRLEVAGETKMTHRVFKDIPIFRISELTCVEFLRAECDTANY